MQVLGYQNAYLEGLVVLHEVDGLIDCNIERLHRMGDPAVHFTTDLGLLPSITLWQGYVTKLCNELNKARFSWWTEHPDWDNMIKKGIFHCNWELHVTFCQLPDCRWWPSSLCTKCQNLNEKKRLKLWSELAHLHKCAVPLENLGQLLKMARCQ